MTNYDEIRARHWAHTKARTAEHFARLGWPEERLREYRTRRLRDLLSYAREHSPWHRDRLSAVDLERVSADDLSAVPTMTKEDVLAHFDDIVTDRRLERGRVEAHLRGQDGDAYLFDQYHVVATGGSSGRRCMFVYDWDGWSDCFLGIGRSTLRAVYEGNASGRPVVMASIMGTDLSHMGAALVETFGGLAFPIHRIPLNRPMDQIVAQLNELNPTILASFPSIWQSLVHEAAAGRLTISPERTVSFSEPLFPAVRSAIKATWPAPLLNTYTSTETGLIATSCSEESGLHVAEDLCIIEPVDEQGRPVPPGVRSAKVLVTNLINRALPLVRYALTDEVTPAWRPCPCGSGLQALDEVEGNATDMFEYAGVRVHRLAFTEALFRDPKVIEFQVFQTRDGAAILVLLSGETDLLALERDVTASLDAVGARGLAVRVTAVDGLERHAATGKLKRFVPLEGGARS